MTGGIPYTYDRNGQLVVDPAELITSPAFREQVRAAARLQEPTVTTRPSNDASPCATPDNREVSGLANSEWVMVPKEPTEEMLYSMDKGSAYQTWKNMLAAAPTPPKAQPAPTPDVIRDAERWEVIEGYSGMYEVSSFGRVKSLNRIDSSGKRRKGKFLVPYRRAKGYVAVALNKCGEPDEQYVHRLVAKAFIPNPSRHPQVNHIDGDPANNVVSNLEWVNASENGLHACRVLGTRVRPIYGISLATGERVDFPSLATAGEAGFKRANISSCLAGTRSHHRGYAWHYTAIDAAIREQRGEKNVQSSINGENL